MWGDCPVGPTPRSAMGNCCPSLFGSSQPKLAVVTLDPKLHGPAVQAGNFNAKGKGTALANAAIHQVRARCRRHGAHRRPGAA